MPQRIQTKPLHTRFTEHLYHHIQNCAICIQSKPAKPEHIKTPLQELMSITNTPEELMQIDLLGKFTPPSGGYNYILTAIDVFSRYLFAVPIRHASTTEIVDALTSIFARHAYLPTKIITDKGTAFTSNQMTDLMQSLNITVKHATIKHAQSIGMVERSHSNIKRILKCNSNETSTDWHRYINMAVLTNNNTTYNDTTGYTPCQLFTGRIPYNAL